MVRGHFWLGPLNPFGRLQAANPSIFSPHTTRRRGCLCPWPRSSSSNFPFPSFNCRSMLTKSGTFVDAKRGCYSTCEILRVLVQRWQLIHSSPQAWCLRPPVYAFSSPINLMFSGSDPAVEMVCVCVYLSFVSTGEVTVLRLPLSCSPKVTTRKLR